MSNPYREAVLAVDRMRWASLNYSRFKEHVASCCSYDDLVASIDSDRELNKGLTD